MYIKEVKKWPSPEMDVLWGPGNRRRITENVSGLEGEEEIADCRWRDCSGKNEHPGAGSTRGGFIARVDQLSFQRRCDPEDAVYPAPSSMTPFIRPLPQSSPGG